MTQNNRLSWEKEAKFPKKREGIEANLCPDTDSTKSIARDSVPERNPDSNAKSFLSAETMVGV
jgi:hypothetical protein